MLTVVVVDDLVALVVIATVVHERRSTSSRCCVGARVFAVMLIGRAAAGSTTAPSTRLLGADRVGGAAASPGVDPVVVGLAMGLLTFAYPAARGDLERATDLFRLFREQPTPELARSARAGLRSAISPNERCSSSTTRGRAT